MPSSAAVDDYLKVVYQHTEWQDERITPSQLAQQLGLAPSSVTEMVQKLAAAGLVDHRRYGPIRLTEGGAHRAAAIVRRHRLVETWLVREYGYTWDEVHDEAEILEHALSDRLLDRIDAQLGRPRFDPHGDAIPDAAGRTERVPFIMLGDAPAGHFARVLRVSDRDPQLLRELDRLGVDVGRELTVVDATAPALDVRFAGDSDAVALPREAYDAIWLSA
ncbi:metal-dependent transcriptional regulator [Microbacterium sp. cx-55]|uniref:metal-dependent transcriptional regulator n=1 Tax=Microbacterium sp. cx-55 TaxID=2875948 RepID=UPI001CC0BD0E|nr:metal-dependent transcriptional regulator [Microbacterium sp. cx-55]MBZ4488402.1 metal-dependent transcriptional regulator [Microbacterium sp. cx-55]UGB35054.1 metal-dependent transcriptional regulator [Microbacterium sp. cx-55]